MTATRCSTLGAGWRVDVMAHLWIVVGHAHRLKSRNYNVLAPSGGVAGTSQKNLFSLASADLLRRR